MRRIIVVCVCILGAIAGLFLAVSSQRSAKQYPTFGLHYYGSFVNYRIPFQPKEPLTANQAKLRNAYYVAFFDENGKIVLFTKYLNGKVDFSDEYTYNTQGIPIKRKITKSNGQIVERSL